MSGLSGFRRSGRLRLPHWLVLPGILGVLLSAFVLQSAVVGFGHVSRSNSAAALISRAQRYHQDADQSHDALHSDVLEALNVGRAGDPVDVRRVRNDLTHDASDYRAFIDKVRAVHVGGSLEKALSDLRPTQHRYVDTAVRIGNQALKAPDTATSQLPQFNTAFTDLVSRQASATNKLSGTVAATTAERDRTLAGAERRIITACLIAVGGLIGLAVALARIGRRLDLMVSREHAVAETLQRSLIPERLPDVTGLRLAARYLPATKGHEIGGDWYDVVALPTGQIAFIIADVVGHDIGAASVMGHLRNVARSYALDGLAPSEVLVRMNRLLTTFEVGQMATCVYGLIDPDLTSVTMANAGHCPPLVIGPGGVTVLELSADPPLGSVRNFSYSQTSHHIAPGSTALFYTDGLIERRQESFQDGQDRLAEVAAPGNWVTSTSADLDTLCDLLLESFFAAAPPTDDVAVLAFTSAVRLDDVLHLSFPAASYEIARMRHALSRWLAEAGADDEESYTFTVAVAEAASNAVEHAYGPHGGTIEVTCSRQDGTVTTVVRDHGSWRPPRGVDRGRGVDLMKAFTDDAQITSTEDGTEIRLQLKLHAPHLAELR